MKRIKNHIVYYFLLLGTLFFTQPVFADESTAILLDIGDDTITVFIDESGAYVHI